MKYTSKKDIFVILMSVLLSSATAFFTYTMGWTTEWLEIGLVAFLGGCWWLFKLIDYGRN
jgi:hypothetical protein